MFERFTDRARKVLALANQEAQRFNHEFIGTEHILLGLVKEGSGVGANVLKNLDVDLRRVRLKVEERVRAGADTVPSGKLPQTERSKKVIEYAIEEARNLNHTYVGTEHLLLGLLRNVDNTGARVLMALDVKLEEAREEVLNLLGAGVEPVESEPPDPIPEERRRIVQARMASIDTSAPAGKEPRYLIFHDEKVMDEAQFQEFITRLYSLVSEYGKGGVQIIEG